MKKKKREKLILPEQSWDLDKLRKIAQKIKEYERLEDEREKTIRKKSFSNQCEKCLGYQTR